MRSEQVTAAGAGCAGLCGSAVPSCTPSVLSELALAPRGCSGKHRGAEAEGLSRAGSSLAPVLGLSHCGQKCICGHGNDPSALVLPGYFCISWGELCESCTSPRASLCGCEEDEGSPFWLLQPS